MDSSAGEEASNAPGITSVRISRGSIRPDECALGGRLYECAQCGVPYESSQMERIGNSKALYGSEKRHYVK